LIAAALAGIVMGVGTLWYAGQAAQPSSSTSMSSGDLKVVGSLKAADYHSLVFHPSEPNTLYFGHHNGVMMSRDGGKTWTPTLERAGFDAMTLGVSPSLPNTLWMAGHDVFYRSTDGGRAWSEVATSLPGLDLHAFTVSSVDPNQLYAFAVGFGLFKSGDGGATWQPLGPGAPQAPMALAAGGEPEALYIGTEKGVVISRDGGAGFSQPIAIGTAPISALAVGGGHVYAGTPIGLYCSQDSGVTWTRMGYSGFVVALAVDPKNPQRVVLIDRQGKVFSSA
jgi:photosystem II stability/assembly factor-like uncharacterized protein